MVTGIPHDLRDCHGRRPSAMESPGPAYHLDSLPDHLRDPHRFGRWKNGPQMVAQMGENFFGAKNVKKWFWIPLNSQRRDWKRAIWGCPLGNEPCGKCLRPPRSGKNHWSYSSCVYSQPHDFPMRYFGFCLVCCNTFQELRAIVEGFPHLKQKWKLRESPNRPILLTTVAGDSSRKCWPSLIGVRILPGKSAGFEQKWDQTWWWFNVENDTTLEFGVLFYTSDEDIFESQSHILLGVEVERPQGK